MAADKQNLQDAFLNHVRKAKVPVTIFLINGVKLQGVITWFDNFCVLLRRDGQSQLVYKHAISTIMPGAPISLYEGEDGSPATTTTTTTFSPPAMASACATRRQRRRAPMSCTRH